LVVYLDLLLVLNFSFNFALLIIAGWMGLQQFRARRYIFAALVGTIIWLIFFLSNQYIFIDWLCRIAGGLAMVFIAWRPNTLRDLLSRAFMLVVAGQLMGGGIFSLAFALGGTTLGNQSVSLTVVTSGGALMLAVAAVAIGRFHSTRQLKSYLGEVIISFQGTALPLSCLLDSGNTLRHPVNSWPVVIIERDAASLLFSSEIMGWIDQPLSLPPPDIATRVGLVSFNSVGGSGMLAVVRPDKVVLRCARGSRTLFQVYVAVRQMNTRSLEHEALAFPVDNWEEGDIV
jgi:stage II sporulation protein GA (sporulation sigma-E factor processing peptidase)